ncbi:MAG: hypothetical protein M1834_002910 [Cirrosporium novae-zelandiae]|nr:MAG: hypothetical protein M1834_002910 [Cirrosporium novae-zelandiae]
MAEQLLRRIQDSGVIPPGTAEELQQRIQESGLMSQETSREGGEEAFPTHLPLGDQVGTTTIATKETESKSEDPTSSTSNPAATKDETETPSAKQGDDPNPNPNPKDSQQKKKENKTSQAYNLSSTSSSEGLLLSAPGARASQKISKTLSPVGKPLGTVFEKTTQPVGALVGSTVGGVFKAGEAWGGVLGVGCGNEDLKRLDEREEKRKEREWEKLRGEGFGGKEQTGENPLGL